jgi:putative peptidoglycan lipid II flippase
MRGLVLGAIIATAVVPINAFIARAMASGLPEGSVSALAYAFRLFILPVSLFAVPVYTVLLTELSTAHQQGEQQRFKEQAGAGVALLFAVVLPATAVLIALATPLTRLVYERGQFTSADTLLTSQALIAYGVGVLAYGTSQVMVRLFNATKDTTTPAFVGLGSIGLSIGGNWLFREWWGHWGIALVTSLVSYVNTIVLYAIFRHRYGPLDESDLLRRFTNHFLLSALLGIVLFGLGSTLLSPHESLTSPLQFLYFAGVLSVGGAVYVGLAFLFKIEEVLRLSRKITQRLKRRR